MSVTLTARGLVRVYRDGGREVPVLHGIDLEVAAGQMVAIVGPSGSGKSTLLHLLGALDRPDRGHIEVGGVDLAALTEDARAAFRNRTVGFVFQFHQLLADFDALENVMMPGRIAGWSRAECERRARWLLGEVGLEDRSTHFPSELSGGEQQRVALCRALLLEPPLLLADEPTGNLDPESGEVVFALLRDLQLRHGTTAVLVTHNPGLAARCDRVLRLEGGRIVAVTPRAEPGHPAREAGADRLEVGAEGAAAGLSGGDDGPALG
jgi:lipoprotein-releasing system ATP-binding protein